MRFWLNFLIFVLLALPSALAQEVPLLEAADRIRLQEAFRLAETLQDSIWDGWSKVPFPVLLVTPKFEYLVHHPKPENGLDTLGFDEKLKSLVLHRRQQFPINFLATFPFMGPSTIVIGQLKNTSVPHSTAWIITVMHEHFHQLQYSQPDYFSATASLNLSRGDQSGMWMLNYAFPYDTAVVVEKFSALCKLLSEALNSSDTVFPTRLREYLDARNKFKKILSKDDYNYFSLQLWQEGISRYTEYRFAKLASQAYTPSNEVRSLPDFQPYSSVADSLLKTIHTTLPTLSLPRLKRIVFYTFGAAEGLLLDRVNPLWHQKYFRDKFYLENYYEP